MNNFATLKKYLLEKPEATLSYPFGDAVPVFKVRNKMFALIGFRDKKMNLNLKCDPEEASILRNIFTGITAGYHMNKRHWITIYFDHSVPDKEVLRLIDNSFMLVVKKMSKRTQAIILKQL